MLLKELIDTPIREFPKYLNLRLKDVLYLKEYGEKVKAEGDELENSYTDEMKDIWYSIDNYSPIGGEKVRVLEYFLRNFSRILDVDGFINSIEYIQQYDAKKGMGWILDKFKYMEDRIHYITDVQEIFDNNFDDIEPSIMEWGFEPGNHVVKKFMEMLSHAKSMMPKIKQVLAMKEKLEKQLSIMDKMYTAQWGDGKYVPDHEKTEVLYHATAFATEILRDGFSVEAPQGRTGVGNYGSQGTISFTHDLYIAKEIARCLKEVCMIANGQVKLPQVLDWIKRENPDIDLNNLMREEGVSVRNKEGPIVVPPDRVVRMYNRFLWSTKMRSNPVFASYKNLITNLTGRNPQDIGVLACKVDMSQMEDYIPAEREVRVPASAVLSVKRIM